MTARESCSGFYFSHRAVQHVADQRSLKSCCHFGDIEKGETFFDRAFILDADGSGGGRTLDKLNSSIDIECAILENHTTKCQHHPVPTFFSPS